MANPEYEQLLRQGVKVWNNWIKEHYLVEPEAVRKLRERFKGEAWGFLKEESLRKLDLSGIDLSGQNLSGAILVQTNLRKANLQNVNLSNAWLSEAYLQEADLNHANLCNVQLEDADLYKANLSNTNLNSAKLAHADLRHANLDGAQLFRTVFDDANLEGIDLTKIANQSLGQQDLANATLTGANLSHLDIAQATLTGADLRKANLMGCSLVMARLKEANLSHANLDGADLTFAEVGWTTFAGNDLSGVQGLEKVRHLGPSTVDIDTLYKSRGYLPAIFLSGCGVPDHFINSLPALIGATQSGHFYSCFISYNKDDEDFAGRLHLELKDAHIRVWFAPEDIEGGKKIYEQIDEAIQNYDKLMIVLSKSSLRSEWVMTEIRRAREVEQKRKRRKLFPIRLVDMETIREWECFDADSGKDLAVELREYFIPDFSNWKEKSAFATAFERLLRDLQADEPNPLHA